MPNLTLIQLCPAVSPAIATGTTVYCHSISMFSPDTGAFQQGQKQVLKEMYSTLFAAHLGVGGGRQGGEEDKTSRTPESAPVA